MHFTVGLRENKASATVPNEKAIKPPHTGGHRALGHQPR